MSRAQRLLVAGLTALVAVLVVRGLSSGSQAAGDPVVGREAPALSGTTLDGDRLAEQRWRGRTTVVNVWASWCGPCREELPVLAAFAAQAGPGVAVVSIDTRDGPAAARSLLEEVEAQGLVAVQDRDGRMAVDWGATGVPETFVVGPDGVIRARVRGGVTRSWLEREVAAWRAG